MSLANAAGSISADRIRGHLQNLVGVRHPVADPAALQKAENDITAHFQKCGLAFDALPFPDNGKTYRNLMATLKGGEIDEHIFVVAHFDSTAHTPGADDNASGTAVLMELATVLAPLTFKRKVHLVAVNLEELQIEDDYKSPSLRGSKALVQHVKKQGWNVAGAFVLEMVAYAGDNIPQNSPAGLPMSLPKAGNFLGAVGNQNSVDLLKIFGQAVQQFKAGVAFVPFAVPGNGEILPDVRRSDHAPFWDGGYKALMVTDTANFRNPHYHKTTDSIDTLNFDFAASVGRATAGAIGLLAEEK